MKAKSIIIDKKPSDQTYLIGSSPLAVKLPTFTWSLPQATTKFTYGLLDAPDFITITDFLQEI